MLVHKTKFIFSFNSGAISNMCRALSYSVSLLMGAEPTKLAIAFWPKLVSFMRSLTFYVGDRDI